MTTICDLRPRQIGAASARLSECPDAASASKSATKINADGGAEIILFPKFSVKALKRPRKALTRRHNLRARS